MCYDITTSLSNENRIILNNSDNESSEKVVNLFALQQIKIMYRCSCIIIYLHRFKLTM